LRWSQRNDDLSVAREGESLCVPVTDQEVDENTENGVLKTCEGLRQTRPTDKDLRETWDFLIEPKKWDLMKRNEGAS
jgi:hypothetical protein